VAKAHQVWARATTVQAAKADTAVAENAAGRTAAAAEMGERPDTIPMESLERFAAIAPADVGPVRDQVESRAAALSVCVRPAWAAAHHPDCVESLAHRLPIREDTVDR
jgi:hypothetical protein